MKRTLNNIDSNVSLDAIINIAAELFDQDDISIQQTTELQNLCEEFFNTIATKHHTDCNIYDSLEDVITSYSSVIHAVYKIIDQDKLLNYLIQFDSYCRHAISLGLRVDEEYLDIIKTYTSYAIDNFDWDEVVDINNIQALDLYIQAAYFLHLQDRDLLSLTRMYKIVLEYSHYLVEYHDEAENVDDLLREKLHELPNLLRVAYKALPKQLKDEEAPRLLKFKIELMQLEYETYIDYRVRHPYLQRFEEMVKKYSPFIRAEKFQLEFHLAQLSFLRHLTSSFYIEDANVIFRFITPQMVILSKLIDNHNIPKHKYLNEIYSLFGQMSCFLLNNDQIKQLITTQENNDSLKTFITTAKELLCGQKENILDISIASWEPKASYTPYSSISSLIDFLMLLHQNGIAKSEIEEILHNYRFHHLHITHMMVLYMPDAIKSIITILGSNPNIYTMSLEDDIFAPNRGLILSSLPKNLCGTMIFSTQGYPNIESSSFLCNNAFIKFITINGSGHSLYHIITTEDNKKGITPVSESEIAMYNNFANNIHNYSPEEIKKQLFSHSYDWIFKFYRLSAIFEGKFNTKLVSSIDPLITDSSISTVRQLARNSGCESFIPHEIAMLIMSFISTLDVCALAKCYS